MQTVALIFFVEPKHFFLECKLQAEVVASQGVTRVTGSSPVNESTGNGD